MEGQRLADGCRRCGASPRTDAHLRGTQNGVIREGSPTIVLVTKPCHVAARSISSAPVMSAAPWPGAMRITRCVEAQALSECSGF